MRATCAVTLLIASIAPVRAAENDYSHLIEAGLVDWGGGEKVFEDVPHLTEAQRKAIQEEIDGNIRMLRSQGRLATALVPGGQLSWPLARHGGLADFDYHGISNFVDLNPVNPGQILDYQCGARTYDQAGYNHGGIDYFTWPFGWLKMDNSQVAVVAAAPGMIVGREDGRPDRSCGFNGLPWNAVYVRQDDGSVAWYGHLKRDSLTTKGVGETVGRGEYLGIVGSSGNSTGPHLHLELHDMAGAIVEPHTGPCNPSPSWWQIQRPYRDSAINKLTTGWAAPSFPSCPNQEDPREQIEFPTGSIVYFTAYYHDQTAGQLSQFRIVRPDGSVFQTWNQVAPNTYNASWWWWSWNLTAAPPGIWRFEATFDAETYTHYFGIGGPFAVSRVPERDADGTPLSVSLGPAATLQLAWGTSCQSTETDWAIYEGTIGSYYSHQIRTCTTGGTPSASLTAPAGDAYYLVVPRNEAWEGSYGTDSNGAEIPAAFPACRTRYVGTCCGNGRLETPEVCDGPELAGQTCQTQGYDGGTLTCAAGCAAFSTTGCTTICGDNIRKGQEACDGTDLAGQTCSTRGYGSGQLACAPHCMAFDESGCVASVCGNNVKETGEACDGTDLGGETCTSQGQPIGSLACRPDCMGFDYTNCGL